jgi:lipoprotein Spr
VCASDGGNAFNEGQAMMDVKVSGPPARRWPAIVAAARSCIGTRFRAQGRKPGVGLDCVGVALFAAAAAGLGCTAIVVPLPGDIMLIAPAPRRLHLAVVTPAGIVHAHAAVGRVVEAPIDIGWSIIGAWRVPGAY